MYFLPCVSQTDFIIHVEFSTKFLTLDIYLPQCTPSQAETIQKIYVWKQKEYQTKAPHETLKLSALKTHWVSPLLLLFQIYVIPHPSARYGFESLFTTLDSNSIVFYQQVVNEEWWRKPLQCRQIQLITGVLNAHAHPPAHTHTHVGACNHLSYHSRVYKAHRG